ncbi:hypothetical protein Glove_357g18 [Diversispora epigaea]|uniref:Serine-threonine/tyrosine-protein kinase catalytic domain-containing protein n=1 Tax=Diversispora epigaea TaxID=1348612 RepID=A0A397HIF2_9GLOM|nr:hypothetical protein Glove_357g18 [Diversispora epigaea]
MKLFVNNEFPKLDWNVKLNLAKQIANILMILFMEGRLKGKREMIIPGTPPKYKEIYAECWKHDKNSRPNISQEVENLSEIIIANNYR